MVNKYLTREARAYNGVKKVSSINGVGKIGQAPCKINKQTNKQSRLLTYTIYKDKFKMDKRLKCKS